LGAAALQTGVLSADAITLDAQTVASGDGALEFVFTVPAGYKFNDLGPFTLSWESTQPGVIETAEEQIYEQLGPEFPIVFSANFSEGETVVRVAATVYYCEANQEEFCLVEDVLLEIPLIVDPESENDALRIAHRMPGLQ
jgi:hypothetical protein